MAKSKSSKSNANELDNDLSSLEAALDETLESLDDDQLFSNIAQLPQLKSYQSLKQKRQRFYQANPKPKDAYHHGDLAAALIDSAIQLIEENGIASLSLRGIARLAGVSQAAPYRHFKDKDALLTAVAVKGFTLLQAHMLDAVHEGLNPWEQLLVLSQGYLLFTEEHRAYFKVMFGPDVNSEDPTFQTAQQEAIGLFISAILEGQSGAYFRTDTPADIQGLTIWSLLHGFTGLVAYQHIDLSNMSVREPSAVVDTLLLYLREGLSPN